jgi:hypothetical protein
MKIRSAGVELLHADRQTDRQTDMMWLKVAVCHFVNSPKNVSRNTVKYFSGNDGNVLPNVLLPLS